jgi:hypothetical protein
VGLAASGSYTVTPTKTARTPGSAGINTLDVVAVQKHFLGSALLTGCRLTAANVIATPAVNTLDVIAVQKFFLGTTLGGNTGKYFFQPATRTYAPLGSNQAAQDFSELIFGDVAGPFVSPPRPGGPGPDAAGNDSDPELSSSVAVVSLPEVAVTKSTMNNVAAAVTTSAIDGKDKLIAFQGDFTFDERVVTFDSQPVQPAGLTANNWNVAGNVLDGPGPIRTLRISAFSNNMTPLSGPQGTLFELRMSKVNNAAQGSQLIWAAAPNSFIFIDNDLKTQSPGNVAPGSVSPSSRQR